MGIKWDLRNCGEMRKISRGLKLQFDEKMEVEKWGTIAGLVVLVGAGTNKVKDEEEENDGYPFCIHFRNFKNNIYVPTA